MESILKPHLKQKNRNLIVQKSLDAACSKNESEFSISFLPSFLPSSPSPFSTAACAKVSQINKKLWSCHSLPGHSRPCTAFEMYVPECTAICRPKCSIRCLLSPLYIWLKKKKMSWKSFCRELCGPSQRVLRVCSPLHGPDSVGGGRGRRTSHLVMLWRMVWARLWLCVSCHWGGRWQECLGLAFSRDRCQACLARGNGCSD